MNQSYKHARRGYTYRRIGVMLVAFLPLWAIYCFYDTPSLLFSVIATATAAIPTAGLAGALFTVADSELEFAHYLKKKDK